MHAVKPAVLTRFRMTNAEFAIWQALASREGTLVKGNDLLVAAFGPLSNALYRWDSSSRWLRPGNRKRVQNVVYTLRRLLDASGSEYEIFTVWNKGYMARRKG